jgi:hypothetical protein
MAAMGRCQNKKSETRAVLKNIKGYELRIAVLE